MNLQCNNISKSYFNIEGKENPILNSIDLELNSGQSLAIMGPSGSGKTTLLKILGLLETYNNGDYIIDSEEMNHIDEEKSALYRNQHIGFVFQSHLLLPQCTMLENILLPTLVSKQSQTDSLERATHFMKRIGIENLIDQFPNQLSGGECQRAAFVRALINKPKLILADEPTGALDFENANKLSSLLIDLTREEGIALILATHANDIAKQCDKVVHLKNGNLS